MFLLMCTFTVGFSGGADGANLLCVLCEQTVVTPFKKLI